MHVLLHSRWQPGRPSFAGRQTVSIAKSWRLVGRSEGARWGRTNSLPATVAPSIYFPKIQSPVTLSEPGLQEQPQKLKLPEVPPVSRTHPEEVDAFYLFACSLEWERRGEPSAAWELLSAARSLHADTRAHARSLLAGSQRLSPHGIQCTEEMQESSVAQRRPQISPKVNWKPEVSMKGLHGPTADHPADCACRRSGFFSSVSAEALAQIDRVCRRSTIPAGAIMFVEGQLSRGIYVVCSGKVKLSTTSREGKVLMLKTVGPGEAIGLSAAISGQCYEMTAETGAACQLAFVDRQNLLTLLEKYSGLSLHAAQSVSREYQTAYRDIQELILARSSTGKLARLLLSSSPGQLHAMVETPLDDPMTHEEMAQRIGSSRETVTRLLSDLKKKKLIRHDGETLIIRNRTALEALAV